MKIIYLLLPLLLQAFLANGQPLPASDSASAPLKIYFGQNRQPADSSHAYLYLVIQADSLQADVRRVVGYFKSGERYYQGLYKPSAPDSLRWQEFFSAGFAERSGAQGEHTYWYANGQKEQEGSYAAGVKTGLHQQWYMNGILFTQLYFQEGQPHGECLVYYPDGSKKLRLNYEQGVLEGEAIDYGKDGQKDRRYRLKKGFLEAVLTP